MIDARHNTGFKIISSASMYESLVLIHDLDQPKLMFPLKCAAVLSKNAAFLFYMRGSPLHSCNNLRL